MFKAQFKRNSTNETWTTLGSYSSESQALSSATNKKKQGVLMVRVVDKNGNTIFSQ